jgi:nitrate/nitrite transport system substrate-binding protein
MRDDTTPPATAASAYDPYDADRPLMLRCGCGADHAPTEHGAAAPLPDTETMAWAASSWRPA